MRHKLCRSFHPWCPGVKTRCLCLYDGSSYIDSVVMLIHDTATPTPTHPTHPPQTHTHKYTKTLFTHYWPFSGKLLFTGKFTLQIGSNAVLWWLLFCQFEVAVEQKIDLSVICELSVICTTVMCTQHEHAYVDHNNFPRCIIHGAI